ncbi:MAG: cysteine synthase family protein [Spirochaetaceae bacterium]|jgi:cysteine synthase B|nr:cysteine synthase family protein [Spirochaetaceae bacterium]
MHNMGILDLVGNTALVELPKTSRALNGIKLFAKAEFLNPSGSVKDRAVKSMLLDGIKRGNLREGKTIIDATSGNSGIAYAMFGAALGFPVVLYLPANASRERKRMISSFGAKIIETDPLESSDGAYFAACKVVEQDPERWFFADQYNNEENWRAHYNTTAIEIWEQTKGEITHFVSGLGTSGTFTGISKKLRELSPTIKSYAMQADSPFHGIEGTKHMASVTHTGFYDERLPDGFIELSTEDAYEQTRRLAREEGLFVGISSGANVAAALKLAERLPSGSTIVTMLCDSGSRYISDDFWTAGI